MNYKNHLILILLPALILSCHQRPSDVRPAGTVPSVSPDYTGTTIPPNIAPLNFSVNDEGTLFLAEVHGKDGSVLKAKSASGTIRFGERKWKKFLGQNKNSRIEYTIYVKREGEWYRFEPFSQVVAAETIDPYLYYRLLHPGYESWTRISIVRRHLESFSEKTVAGNNVLEQNCINCHTFNRQQPGNFMFHVRGNNGGTYFLEDDNLKKVNLKAGEMPNGATYPSWHPSGKYIAFSSNKVIQQFHGVGTKKIEVSDLNSKLVLYDTQRNELSDVVPGNQGKFMDTYPEWSPCGRFLYFCRAEQVDEPIDFSSIRYDLYRIAFDAEKMSFGVPDAVYLAGEHGKSVSFPKISPAGNTLVFTMHDYGCFPVWHQEADLYALDTESGMIEKLPVNSEFTESYHSWSSNGRWLIFSSKRGDGLSARPYIAYMGAAGSAGKPFILPQKNPRFYDGFLKTFNLPELSESAISFSPRRLRKAAAGSSPAPAWRNN